MKILNMVVKHSIQLLTSETFVILPSIYECRNVHEVEMKNWGERVRGRSSMYIAGWKIDVTSGDTNRKIFNVGR